MASTSELFIETKNITVLTKTILKLNINRNALIIDHMPTLAHIGRDIKANKHKLY